MRESKCYISVACFHYGGSDLLRFGKFEVLITSQALLSQKQPIFMQNYNFVKNDVFVAKICKYALYESSEGLFCAPRKAANFCHPGCIYLGWKAKIEVKKNKKRIFFTRNISSNAPSTRNFWMLHISWMEDSN